MGRQRRKKGARVLGPYPHPRGQQVVIIAEDGGRVDRYCPTEEEAQDLIREWHQRGWTPMGRLATPADVGNAAALLCSPEAGFITGQIIAVDGGASLMNAEAPPEIQLARPS